MFRMAFFFCFWRLFWGDSLLWAILSVLDDSGVGNFGVGRESARALLFQLGQGRAGQRGVGAFTFWTILEWAILKFG